MNVSTKQVSMLTITDAPLAPNRGKLDPVRVIVENLAPGRGRIFIECFGNVWTAYWGGMGGGSTVEEFVERAPTDYLVDKLLPHGAVGRLGDDAYLTRIVDAVRQAIREQLAGAELGREFCS